MSPPAMRAEISSVMPYSEVIQHAPEYTLFRGSGGATTYASSPFVTKVEFRMRIAGVSYKVDCGAPWLGPVWNTVLDGISNQFLWQIVPMGKIPYMSSSSPSIINNGAEKGDLMGDSALIIKHLMETDGLKNLNEMLDPAEKAKDLALRALLEDKLYFYHMRECWIDNYYAQRDQALSGVPFPARFFVGQIVYKKVVRTLFGQGAGRYTSADIESFRTEIWESINDLLCVARDHSNGNTPDQPYWCLGGANPTEADITLFGFISAITTGSSCPLSASLLRSFPAVMEYADLIHKKYFPDYAQWLPNKKTLASETVTVLARF